MNAMNEAISNIGVVPVIKLNHPERDAVALANALCEGGVPVAEVTYRAAGAATAFKLMREAKPDLLVGAGTVLTTEPAAAPTWSPPTSSTTRSGTRSWRCARSPWPS